MSITPSELSPTLLTLSSLDASGQGGLSVDLRVFSDFEAEGRAIVTGLMGADDEIAIPIDLFLMQLDRVTSSYKAHFVKIGSIASAVYWDAIASRLRHLSVKIVVVSSPFSTTHLQRVGESYCASLCFVAAIQENCEVFWVLSRAEARRLVTSKRDDGDDDVVPVVEEKSLSPDKAETIYLAKKIMCYGAVAVFIRDDEAGDEKAQDVLAFRSEGTTRIKVFTHAFTWTQAQRPDEFSAAFLSQLARHTLESSTMSSADDVITAVQVALSFTERDLTANKISLSTTSESPSKTTSLNKHDDERWMKVCLQEARDAADKGEVPVGAIVVCDGKIVGRGHNGREEKQDPLAHAEMEALRMASSHLRRWRLHDCTLYVTLEPCFMCAGALVNARVKRLVFGAADKKAGATGSLQNVCSDARLNHVVEVISGVCEIECATLLQDFFRGLRSKERMKQGKEQKL